MDASRDPQNKLVIVVGDFNFGLQPPVPLNPSDELFNAPLPPLVPGAPEWREVLRKMVEFQLEAPTHYHAGVQHLSYIDRLFCSAPGWVLSQMVTSGEVVGIPEQLLAKHISDHAA
eukprot:691435-Pyramimonas_sp.AAC.1